MSPFLTLRNHPDLAVHVRQIDIHCAPFIAAGQVHPRFLSETADALQVCKNLTSFVCGPRILPALLGSLQGKERLQDLHIYAALTTTQGEMLQKNHNATQPDSGLPDLEYCGFADEMGSAVTANTFAPHDLHVSRSEWHIIGSLAPFTASSSWAAPHWMSKGSSYSGHQSCYNTHPIVERILFHYIRKYPSTKPFLPTYYHLTQPAASCHRRASNI